MSRPKRSRPEDPAALAASIRQRLDAGRTMTALKDAKVLVKRHGGADAEDLLATAYAARIADLGESGMHSEASELVQVASRRFPERAELWTGAERIAARSRGDLTWLLERWLTEPGARDEVAAELRREVRDPGWIADSPVLPEDDPLRVAARGLRTAFEQAAAGGLDDDGRAGLRAVGRRSPLSPWRTFVLALDTFHRHEDSRCRAYLAAIEDDDVVAAGRDVLRAALLDQPMPADLGQARVVTRLVGAAPDAILAAARLADPTLSNSAFFAAVKAGLRALKTIGRRPALRFVRFVANLTDGNSALNCGYDAGIGMDWLGDEWTRLVATLTQAPVEVVASWTMWLVAKPPELRRIGTLDLALALEAIEPVADDFGAIIDAAIGSGSFAQWLRGRSIDPHIDGLMTRGTEDAEMLGGTWIGWSALFSALERRTGIVGTAPNARVRLLRHVVALDPTPARCQRLFVAHDRSDTDGRAAALAAWTEALADDVTPWLILAAEAEDRGALQLAQKHLARAAEIAPIDARVRAAAFRLALASLRKHWRAKKPHLCTQDLDAIDAMPAARTPEVRVFLQLVREWIAGADDPALVTEVGSLARARAARSLVGHVLTDVPVRTFGDTPAERLATAAFVARIAEAVGWSLDEPPSGLDRPTQFTMAELPGDTDDLLAICAFCTAPKMHGLCRLAAGAGLRRDGPRLARFLAHRALSLPLNATRRSPRCAQLARFHAVRLGDSAALRLLDGRWRFGADPLDAAEAADALRAEQEAVDESGRKSRPAARRRRAHHPELPFDGPPRGYVATGGSET